jgi:hypothetical protein
MESLISRREAERSSCTYQDYSFLWRYRTRQSTRPKVNQHPAKLRSCTRLDQTCSTVFNFKTLRVGLHGNERIEWKIIGDFTSCFIHEQGINELAFLQTANEPNLAFSGQNWPFQAFLVRLPSDGRNCSGRANQGQGGWTLHSRT